MIVKEAMHGTTKIPSYTSVTQAAKIMDERIIGSVLVLEGDKVIGIATERDILRKVVASGKSGDGITIKEVMTNPLITIDINAPLEEASFLLDKHKNRRLVVVDNGEIVGMITARKIANSLRFAHIKMRDEYVRREY